MGKHTAPPKAGRPPKYGSAMTPAERAREYRQRRWDRRRVAMRTPAAATLNALLDELRANIKAGDVQAVQRIGVELTARTRANRNASRK